MEGTPIKLKAGKGWKQRSQEQCKARTKAGRPCRAPAARVKLAGKEFVGAEAGWLVRELV
jgi:hypothetical protein